MALKQLLVLAVIMASLILPLLSHVASSQIEVNQTNNETLVKFSNLTVINFTTTLVNIGWLNSTHIASAYSCIYVSTPEQECDTIRIEVYNDTVLKYNASFVPTSNSSICPLTPAGICSGVKVFNVSGFTGEVKVKVIDVTQGISKIVTLVYPYKGPSFEGYAKYIPIIVPYAILFGLAGRLSLKNIGIGLFIYGLLAPAMTVIGLNVRNIMLLTTLSIILGVILIWVSNQ